MDGSKSNVRKRNIESKTKLTIASPVGVFVGGTSGIGEGAVYAFARHTTRPVIYIVGRNSKAAEEIIEKCKEINSEGTYEFFKHDLALLSEVQTAIEEIRAKTDKINTLCLSQGAAKLERRNTAEGLDEKLVVFYYSRVKFTLGLVDLLVASSEKDEPARVDFVANPTIANPVDKDHVGLKDYSFMKFANQLPTYMSLACFELGKLYPNVVFIHEYPGAVQSNLMRDLPWYFRYPMAVANYFFESNEDCGERLHYLHYADSEYFTTGGGYLFDGKLADITLEMKRKGKYDEESQELIWNHTKKVIDSVQ